MADLLVRGARYSQLERVAERKKIERPLDRCGRGEERRRPLEARPGKEEGRVNRACPGPFLDFFISLAAGPAERLGGPGRLRPISGYRGTTERAAFLLIPRNILIRSIEPFIPVASARKLDGGDNPDVSSSNPILGPHGTPLLLLLPSSSTGIFRRPADRRRWGTSTGVLNRPRSSSSDPLESPRFETRPIEQYLSTSGLKCLGYETIIGREGGRSLFLPLETRGERNEKICTGANNIHQSLSCSTYSILGKGRRTGESRENMVLVIVRSDRYTHTHTYTHAYICIYDRLTKESCRQVPRTGTVPCSTCPRRREAEAWASTPEARQRRRTVPKTTRRRTTICPRTWTTTTRRTKVR